MERPAHPTGKRRGEKDRGRESYVQRDRQDAPSSAGEDARVY